MLLLFIYLFSKGAKKCMMVVRDDQDHRTTIGSAAVQCATKNAKLVSFDSCDSIEETMNDLQGRRSIDDEKFWMGVFAPGLINKRAGKRNFLEVGEDYLIDS